METTKYKSPVQPKTLAELLPSLKGILSKESMQTLTARKQPRPTMAQTRTTEKALKPLTIAEMSAGLRALKVNSPRTIAQAATTSKKRNWNSSTKLECKTKNCTADGQMKQSTVRKVLEFHPRPAPPRATTMVAETPKFQRPESRPKKTLHVPAKGVRISGICNIPETPTFLNKPTKSRMTIGNKENNSRILNINKKIHETPKSINLKKITPSRATPLSNISYKSNSDASFLQKEKEIDEIEGKINAITEESTLERIAEVSPPASTPFKEYRSIQEYFNKTNDTDNSTLFNDNTIMSFNNVSENKTSKREESVIVSLCDLLNKATVTATDAEHKNTELDDLLEVEKQTEHDLRMIQNAIVMLTNIKKSQIKSLQNVRKLINKKKIEVNNTKNYVPDTENNVKEVKYEIEHIKEENTTPERSVPLITVEHVNGNNERSSVIKSKSPSYKIPKKTCLRKKVFYKSMPNVCERTSNKDPNDRAFNMYMQMKEKMNFLNTPIVKQHIGKPNTPTITSHNLKKQLDKLFNCS